MKKKSEGVITKRKACCGRNRAAWMEIVVSRNLFINGNTGDAGVTKGCDYALDYTLHAARYKV